MNEVTFVNEVEMFNTSVEDEDDLLFRFIDHLEEEQDMDIDMEENASSIIVHAGWHDKDNEFNITRLSS